jgi:GNAT superfamily N-acetyltransferase
MSEQIRLLIITGTMGTGKTTVLLEASDILSATGIIHAAIDLDTLGISYLPDEDLMFRNLAAVWSNYRAAGIRRLLLAYAVETAADLNCIRAAVPDAELVWLLIKRGRIRAVQVGTTWLVNKADIENYDPHPGGRPKKSKKKASKLGVGREK